MAKPVMLAVDDDPEVLQAISRDLRKRYGERYRVVRADSGPVALDALRELKRKSEPVALFLVDQRMPRMNGVDFLQEAAPLFPAAKRALLTAYADDITVEQSPFVSSRTREEVSAELKIPYPGGNPWSGTYNMFQARSTATSEQIQGEYTVNRDRANAFHGEDSGSVYIMKAQGSLAPTTAAMGAPAR